MNSVYDYLKPTNEPSKNGFDLSSLQTYSAKVGQLIPEVCIETVPNANYRIQIDAFTRTMPLNTAAFARIKENRYVCFVPYSQLWNEFNQMIVGRNDSQDARTYKSYNAVPTFDIGATLQDLRQSAVERENITSFQNSDQLGFSLAAGASKLLDMLGYGYYDYYLSGQPTANTPAPGRANLWRILAYNKIWYNFFRNSVYDNDLKTLGFSGLTDEPALMSTPAQMFNLNDIVVSPSAEGSDAPQLYLENFRSQRSISKLFQMRYIPYKQDEFNGLMPDTQFGAVSSVSLVFDGEASFDGSLVSTGNTSDIVSTSFVTNNQKAIFGSGFFTKSSAVGNLSWPSSPVLEDPGLKSAGSGTTFNSGDNVSVGYTLPNGSNILRAGSPAVDVESIRFSQNSSVPSGGGHNHAISADSLADNQTSHYHTVLSGTKIAELTGADVLRTIRFVADSGGTIDFSGAGFNVLDLVEAQSIQKWRQRALLAGNRTNDNFRAHYGVAPKFDIDLYPDMIGSSDNTISIQEVVSTADTSTEENTSNLGDIAGKGYGVSDKKYFNYQSNDFGVLMVLYAARPEVQYNSFGLDRSNQLVSRNDYFIKEFENNGLEPVTSKDFLANAGIQNLGFSPRFRNYKSVLSKVHGLFNEYPDVTGNPVQDFQSWSVARRDIFNNNARNTDMEGMSLSLATSIRYVNPSIMDTIFALAADSTEKTDHFMINSYVECMATLPMTRLGLPSF